MSDISFSASDVYPERSVTRRMVITAETITPFQPVRVADNLAYVAHSGTSTNAAAIGLSVATAAAGQPIPIVTSGSINISSAPFSLGVVYGISPTSGMVSPIGDLQDDDYLTILGVATRTSIFSVSVFATGGTFAGSPVVSIVTKTTTYTALATDDVILCDASGGAFTVTLPAASGEAGHKLWLKKKEGSSNLVTLDGSGSETLDDALTQTLNAYAALTIVCDGSEWWII